jgi:RNA polymerase sigma-B factor
MADDTVPTQMTAIQRSLVEKNLDLAHHLALDVWRRNPTVFEREDVIEIAYEGLVKAAIKFDPSRARVNEAGEADVAGAFSGFARQKINGAILDWQRKRDHVPRRWRTTYKTLQEAGHGLGRTPQEVADLTGVSIEQVRLVVSAVEATVVSLHDAIYSEHSGDPVSDVEHDSVEGSALMGKIRSAVLGAWDELAEMQQVVLALRYYEGLELTHISEVLEVRLSTVRIAHAEGLLLLHEAMAREAR